jgi:OmcA/MtrC family decaheme c-type cytochrome
MIGNSVPIRRYGAHGGSLVDDPSLCGVCHNANRAAQGWSGNLSYITHAVHGVGVRNEPYTRYRAVSASRPKPIGVAGYPGVLNNCEQCHLPGTYDLSAVQSQAALPNLLWSTVANGTIAAGSFNSPYIATGIDYGNAPSATAHGHVNSLVNSPITHACIGCHDSRMAIEHMKANGGTFYASRGSLNNNTLGGALTGKTEQCLLCHGSGKLADIKAVHSKY